MSRSRCWCWGTALLALCYCSTLFIGLNLLDDQIQGDGSSLGPARLEGPDGSAFPNPLSLHLCPPLRTTHLDSSQLTCTHPPSQDSTLMVVVVVGALSFLGSQIVSEFVVSGLQVRAVEHDSEISAEDELIWYRKEQLLHHHRVMVQFANLSNQAQVEENLFGQSEELVRPVAVVYVPPVSNWRRDVDNDVISKHLEEFVIMLETLRRVSPCTKVVLSSLSKPVLDHMTSHEHHMATQHVWMDTFELTLSTYHSLYDIPMAILRTSGVYGPWSDVATDMYMSTTETLEGVKGRSLELCLYIGDVTKAFHNVIDLRTSCDVLDIGYCNSTIAPSSITYHQPLTGGHASLMSSPGSRYTWNMLDISSVETLDNGVKKTLSWARSYHHSRRHRSSTMERGERRVVFSSYFTTVEDSQRNRRMAANRFQYMREWFMSVRELHMRAVVFHDGLEPQFQHRVTQFYPNVSFQLVPSLKGRSTNDARFYAYLDYLEEHTEIGHVLLTDISDVRFQMDPFELMAVLGDEWLYIGTDIDIFPSMRTMPWLSQRLRGCFGNSSLERGHPLNSLLDLDTVYNAGSIGGKREVMLAALFRIVEYLNTTPQELNCNMPAVNFATHNHFYDRVFTGFPLNSRFLRRQTSPKGVYIVHK